MKRHLITKKNLLEATLSTRKILDIYKEAVTFYGGFGPNLYRDNFDAFKYIQCEMDVSVGDGCGLDAGLLREGAAVSILCLLYDIIASDKTLNFYYEIGYLRSKDLLDSGAFNNVPLAKDAALHVLEGRDLFFAKLQLVYEIYILGYFHRVIAGHGNVHHSELSRHNYSFES